MHWMFTVYQAGRIPPYLCSCWRLIRLFHFIVGSWQPLMSIFVATACTILEPRIPSPTGQGCSHAESPDPRCTEVIDNQFRSGTQVQLSDNHLVRYQTLSLVLYMLSVLLTHPLMDRPMTHQGQYQPLEGVTRMWSRRSLGDSIPSFSTEQVVRRPSWQAAGYSCPVECSLAAPGPRQVCGR
jgi:hypothetical protein